MAGAERPRDQFKRLRQLTLKHLQPFVLQPIEISCRKGAEYDGKEKGERQGLMHRKDEEQRTKRQERRSQHKDPQGRPTIGLSVEQAERLKLTHLDQEIVQPRDIAERLLSNDVQLCCHLGSRPLLDPFNRAIRPTGSYHSVQQDNPLQKQQNRTENP